MLEPGELLVDTEADTEPEREAVTEAELQPVGLLLTEGLGLALREACPEREALGQALPLPAAEGLLLTLTQADRVALPDLLLELLLVPAPERDTVGEVLPEPEPLREPPAELLPL